MVVTAMPWPPSSRPSRSRSAGELGPTLAWPSDIKMTRLTTSGETASLKLCPA